MIQWWLDFNCSTWTRYLTDMKWSDLQNDDNKTPWRQQQQDIIYISKTPRHQDIRQVILHDCLTRWLNVTTGKKKLFLTWGCSFLCKPNLRAGVHIVFLFSECQRLYLIVPRDDRPSAPLKSPTSSERLVMSLWLCFFPLDSPIVFTVLLSPVDDVVTHILLALMSRCQIENKQIINLRGSVCRTAAAETRRALSLLWKHLIKTPFLPTCPTTFSFCSQRFASQTFVFLNYRPPDSNWGPGVPRLKSMSWGGPFNGLRCDYILESLI